MKFYYVGDFCDLKTRGADKKYTAKELYYIYKEKKIYFLYMKTISFLYVNRLKFLLNFNDKYIRKVALVFLYIILVAVKVRR